MIQQCVGAVYSRRSLLAAAILLLFAAVALPAQQAPDALAEYRRGNYSGAIEITRNEIDENPSRIDAYVVMGWSLLALDRYEDAVRWGQDALTVRRWDPRMLHILGEAHYRLGNHAPAIQFLQEYLAENPRGSLRAQVYFYLGDIFYSIGEYNHADIALTAAVADSPRNFRWWNLLGRAREESGSSELAVEAYQQALQLNPDATDVEQALARLQ